MKLKDKLLAIKNILLNKPVMVNTTILFFDKEEIRMFDRLLHNKNKDGFFIFNFFIKDK